MSLSTLKKKIKDDQQDNKDLTDAYYPPELTGANATAFSDRQRSIKDDCVSILALGTFSGITPVVQSQPSGVTLIAWLNDLARQAATLLDPSPIPPANLQTAADNYATIRDETANAINTYT